MEEWKDINGYDGKYKISNFGRVKSLEREIITGDGKRHYHEYILNPSIKDGYKVINLSVSGEVKQKKIHRLIAEAFIPNPDNKPCIDHINGDRSDNRIENLRWCTIEENNNFDLAIKNKKEAHKEQTNDNLIKSVLQYTLDGEFVAEFKSPKEAAESIGCSRSAITKGCREKIKIKGYIWKYKKESEN